MESIVALILLRMIWVGVDSAATVYPKVPGDWGYHTLSSGGQMFYWFMREEGSELPLVENLIPSTLRTRRLMILMEGDPVSSSVAVMNIGRVGPYDLRLKFRNSTPLADASLLFVDSPIGAGWSYATNDTQFSRTYKSAARDLEEFLVKHWFPANPAVQQHEITIFAQRSSAKTAILLSQNLKSNHPEIRLKYLILSGPELSSWDMILGMTEFMKDAAIIEPMEKRALDKKAKHLQQVCDSGKRGMIAKVGIEFWDLVNAVTYGLYRQNILTPAQKGGYIVRYDGKRRLKLGHNKYRAIRVSRSFAEYKKVMEGPVKRMFTEVKGTTGAPAIEWGSQYKKAFRLIRADEYTCPDAVLPALNSLLSSQDIRIAILSAQLDALTPTIGTFAALKRLQWNGTSEFFQSRKDVFLGQVGGPQVFRKVYDKLLFYMVERSGHHVTNDKPELFSAILKDVWSII